MAALPKISEPPQVYLIALGSNQRHVRHGAPGEVLRAALVAMAEAGMAVAASSGIITTTPLGPSQRRYANAAALVRFGGEPPRLLAHLQNLERSFGRRQGGQPWRARVLDLDVVLWQGGAWSSPGLTIPHSEFRQRGFVLGPARQIAGQWRDPLTGLSLAQLHARLTKPRPLPIGRMR